MWYRLSKYKIPDVQSNLFFPSWYHTQWGQSKEPHVFYHVTRNQFRQFDMSKMDLGAHFATSYEQALKIIRDHSPNGNYEGWYIYPVYLNITKPLELNYDPREFTTKRILKYWDGLNNTQKNLIYQEYAKRQPMSTQEDYNFIRGILQGMGYDSIIYPNEYEDEAEGVSVVVFNPSQIKSIYDYIFDTNNQQFAPDYLGEPSDKHPWNSPINPQEIIDLENDENIDYEDDEYDI